MAKKVKPKRLTHIEFVKQLIDKVLTAAKRKGIIEKQIQFILIFCADVSTFLAGLQTKADDQAEYYTWDSGTLLRDFWTEILAYKCYPSEPQELLLLMLKTITTGAPLDSITARYTEHAKAHHHVVGAEQCTFPSIAGPLKTTGEKLLLLHQAGKLSMAVLKTVYKPIDGFKELIPEPFKGEFPPYSCALTFVVNQGVILVMVPWFNNKEVKLAKPFMVYTKGKVSAQTIKRILREISTGFQQAAK